MIYIGLTGWGDHYSLYPPQIKPKDKLSEYGSHFPVVEVDCILLCNSACSQCS